MIRPTQIGFGIRRAAEVAAHAARMYVASISAACSGIPETGLCKCIQHSHALLNYVTGLPEILNFMKVCYALFASVTTCCCLTRDHSKALAICCIVLHEAFHQNLTCSSPGSVGTDVDVLIHDFQTVRHGS